MLTRERERTAPSTVERERRAKRESRFILMPKSNQLARMELEMALRGYQRICTLHRLQPLPCPAQTRCREACPSSQCRPRRARTMRRRWGNTRTHISDDITRPSSRARSRDFRAREMRRHARGKIRKRRRIERRKLLEMTN